MRMNCVLWLAVFLILSERASAEPIQPGAATYDYFNVFSTVLFPGTPLNPGPDPVEFELQAQGTLTAEWDEQIGTTIPFEIPSVVADGFLPTDPPISFQILAGIEEVPQLGPFAGNYLNVVQDPSDPGFPTGDPSSLVSADVVVGGPFAQILADGTFLYSTQYTFEGEILGLPYPVGTEFIGTHDSEVRVQIGAEPDPMVDPVIGLTLAGGVITIVPEPSAIGLLLFAAGGLLLVHRF
jgi:hypothetical protein